MIGLFNKKVIRSLLAGLIAGALLLTDCGGFIRTDNINNVSAASKNLTKNIKVKNSAGKDMTDKEAKALASSSFKLLSSVIDSADSKENVLISPSSILFALGMAENGAKGKTRTQLEKAVNGGIKVSELNKIMSFTRNRMNNSKKVSLNVANSVWYRKDKRVKVKKSFLRKVKQYYGAEVYKASFDQGTVNDVNSWVNKNTNEMIPKILEEADKTQVMYIINAMAFEGEWLEKFKDESIKKDSDFTNIDGTVSKVNMLTEKTEAYFELNGAYGFKKYYEGGEYSFVGIDVPDGKTPAEYVKEISKNGGSFVKAISNMQSGDVYVEFPEYKLDYDVELSKNMKELGAVNAFSKSKANLYNLFEKDKGSNYYFSAVLHKTHIEVDRKGTKAAAVTAVIVNKTTSIGPRERKYVEIKLDHPFVYAIVDNKTNLPVFVGVINSLNQ